MKDRYQKLCRLVRDIRTFSIGGMFKYLSLKVRGRSVLVVGSCRGCGACCKSISLEGKNGWLRSRKEFQKIIIKHPEYQRFQIIGKDPLGFLLFSCSWCTPQGICRDYDKRLTLCSKFPESSLVFAGGTLPVRCGYSFTEVASFKKILQKELDKK